MNLGETVKEKLLKDKNLIYTTGTNHIRIITLSGFS